MSNDLKQQADSLKQAWKPAFVSMRSNPSAYKPHLLNMNLEQLDEVVRAVVDSMSRLTAPRGFRPSFDVARSLAATSLPAAITAAQALGRGEYPQLPNFVAALNQCLTSLHAMLVFQDKSTRRDAIADMGAELSQALSLVETAQTELASKVEQLARAEAILKRLDTEVEKAEASAKEASQSAEQAAAARRAIDEARSSIEEDQEIASELRNQLQEQTTEQAKLRDVLKSQAAAVEQIERQNREQQQLIEDLLPKGASAGLASAFNLRVSQLERTKWLWVSLFLVSIAGLSAFSFLIVSLAGTTAEEVWRQFLHRLPLAAPLIWLGWFSAVQYGNTLRVQEDYAFKEATSKAFAGYRDHMDHLASVDLEEANTAMTLLAARTIEILAREPLRIFKGSERDVSPSHSLLESLRDLRSGSQAKAKTEPE